MRNEGQSILEKSPNIVIIGSLNMDIVLQASKFPDEGETIIGQHFFTSMGGKGANQAVATSRLGANVSMVGAVGQDDFGHQLIENLIQEGIDTTQVTKLTGQTTGVACVQTTPQDNRITVIPGANYLLSPSLIDNAEEILAKADIVLLQMEIPLETVQYAIRKAKKLGKKVILNPAPAFALPKEILGLADYLTPNETELQKLASFSGELVNMHRSAQRLLSLGVKDLVVTLGNKGARHFSLTGERSFGICKVDVVDTTGAGDAFNGGLAFSLANGETVDHAIQFAMKVAALSVTKLGAQTGMPTMEELKKFFGDV